MFLDFLLFRNPDDSQGGLGSFVTSLQTRFNKSFRRQSLHNRFTPQAVGFIKSLVNEQLKRQISTPIEGLAYFNSVKIKDSTRYQIPECLKNDYPGSGGGASGAGVHIQFEYDFQNGRIEELLVTDAKRQDTTDAIETIPSIKKGDLIIRDMGYFVQDVFSHIMGIGAYFLSRVKPKTLLFEYKSGEQIDIKALHSGMKKKGVKRMEMLVTTTQIRQPLRLIVETLPDEVVGNRLGKARREAKKKGRQLSDQYKSYVALNLFMTNVKGEILSTGSVVKLYHIRWQIELRFKAWKSYCQLHKVRKMNKHRFECHLYAKLLLILMVWELGYNFQLICYQNTGRLISLHKFYKMLTDNLEEFRQGIAKSGKQLKNYLTKLYGISSESLLQEKRKYRLNLEDLIPLLFDNQ